MFMLTAFALAVVLLIIFSDEIRGAVDAFWHFFISVCVRSHEVFFGLLNGGQSMLRRPGEVELVPTLLGLILFGFAGVAIVADYFIMKESVRLIWPFEQSQGFVALTLVGLLAAIGLSLHVFRSWAFRIALTVLAVSFIGLQSFIGYTRVKELAELSAQAELFTFDSQPDVAGSLVIDGIDVSIASSTSADNNIKNRTVPPVIDPTPPRLGGLAAALFATGHIVCLMGALQLASRATTWVVASPALLLLSLASGCFFVCRKLAEALAAISTALLRIPEKVRSAAVSWFKTDRAFEKHNAALVQLEREHELIQYQSRLQVDAHLAEEQRELARVLSASMTEQTRDFTRNSAKDLYTQAKAEVTDRWRVESKQVVDHVTQSILRFIKRVTTIFGRWGDQGGHSPAGEGLHPLVTPQHPDEGNGKSTPTSAPITLPVDGELLPTEMIVTPPSSH